MKILHNLDTRSLIRRALATVAVGATLFSLAACGSHKQSTQAESKKTDTTTQTTHVQDPLNVVASVNQWGSLAAQIGGTHVKVTSIISGTNVEAHDFEANTADISTLSSAQVAVVNGANYDAWATKALRSVKNTTVVNAASIMGASEADNPHLWFSKDARKAVAESLKKTYSELLPASKDYFEKQFAAWQKSEDELNTKITDFKTKHKGKTYAATESVAYYLYSDLGLKDVTPEGYANARLNESEPTATDIQSFQTAIEEHKMSFIVNNTQEASDATNMITGIAGKSDVPVVDVSEQLPEKYTTLTQWITALTDDAAQAISTAESAQ
ncbi:metal ABC transporter solute-binding protein, Zn/Mn family [Alloscardovia venturai]|uniref:Metal ABC transporter solute-binding protein, Zn/Mn family n=1 Tax=Alloscardovia venturai TaxID=1769421 RepID=A0ABW2Y497_9BIFI